MNVVVFAVLLIVIAVCMKKKACIAMAIVGVLFALALGTLPLDTLGKLPGVEVIYGGTGELARDGAFSVISQQMYNNNMEFWMTPAISEDDLEDFMERTKPPYEIMIRSGDDIIYDGVFRDLTADRVLDMYREYMDDGVISDDVCRVRVFCFKLERKI